MTAISKLVSLGRLIEQKLVIHAQSPSAQAADVEIALNNANVWNLSNQVSPLLNSANIPETASLQIDIVVDKAFNVSYVVKTTPPTATANTLARLLKANFGNKMKAALMASKLNITDTVAVHWLNF